MDYKEIVALALEGQDYSEKVKDFDENQKLELDKAIKKAASEARTKELEALAAIRKEKARVNDTPPANTEAQNQVVKKFQEEQEAEAKQEFLANPEYKIPAEKIDEFNRAYTKLKDGEVSKSQITSVLKKAFGAVMGDDYLETRKKMSKMALDAAAFNSSGANASGGSGGNPDPSKHSAEAVELFNSWKKAGLSGPNVTLDRAQTVISRGMERKF